MASGYKNPYANKARTPQFKNPFMTGSSASTPVLKAKKDVARNSAIILAAGGKLPDTSSSPGMLERIIGPLQAPVAGVDALINNVVAPSHQVNVFQNMADAAQGKKYVGGSQILGNMGWNPTDKVGQIAKAVAGFGISIVTDPLVYTTFGLGAEAKALTIAKAGELATEGLDAAKLAEFGIDAAGYADELGATANGVGRMAVRDLAYADKENIFRQLAQSAGEQMKDLGGVKVMGQTVVPGDVASNLVPQSVKDFVAAAQASEPARAIGGAFSQTYRLAHDPRALLANAGPEVTGAFDAALAKGGFTDLSHAISGGQAVLQDSANAFAREMPAGTRDAAYAAYQEAAAPFKADATRMFELIKGKNAQISEELAKAVPDLDKVGALQAQATDFYKQATNLANMADWGAFDATLRQMLPGLSNEDVALAQKLMREDFGSAMRANLEADVASAAKIGKQWQPGNAGALYMPNRRGTAAPGVLDFASAKVADQAAAAGTEIPQAVEAAGPAAFSRDPKLLTGIPTAAHKSTAALDWTEQIAKHPDTLTSVPDLLYQRGMETVRTGAVADLRSNLAHQLGTEIRTGMEVPKGMTVLKVADGAYAVPNTLLRQVDQLTAPLLNDDSAAELLGFFNRATSAWRRWATVMNPGFGPSIATRDAYLMYTKGYTDPAAIGTGLEVARGVMGGNLAEAADVVVGHGANAISLPASEVVADVARGGPMAEIGPELIAKYAVGNTGSPAKSLARIGGDVVKGVHTVASVAVYQQAVTNALDKGVALDAAKSIGRQMVDKVLYNYDPMLLTGTEKMLRSLFPFMVFKSQNIPEMASVLLHDPSRISVIGKAQNEFANASGVDLNKDLLPQYQRDMIPLPTPFKDDAGNPLMLNTAAASQELNTFGHPVAQVMQALNPFVKVPIEMAFNQDSYFKAPIQDYAGQLKVAPGYLQLLNQMLDGQDWWTAIQSKTSMRVDDGVLKMNPYAIKVFDSVPFLANLGKALPGPAATAATPNRRRSWLTGIKMIPYDTNALQTSATFNQRRALSDQIRAMKDAGIIAKKSK